MKTVLNIKIDEKLKTEAQAVAKELGLPMSTIIAGHLSELVRTRAITFSVNPILKPEVVSELKRRSKEAKQGKNLSPAFSDLKQARKWMES